MTVRWNAEALWEQVAPLLPGFTVEVLPQIGSTNTELMQRARSGLLEPSLLVAERQTAGRGRMGREWHSENASLTFSLGLPLQPLDWSGLSLAVGLAVVQSLHPALKLKWPNDVWLGERKLAGILIETANLGDVRFVVVGIGINLQTRAHQDGQIPSAGLAELLPQADAPAALSMVLLPLVQAMLHFAEHGFAPLRTAFHSRDLLYGRDVVCTNGITGLARGVDAAGALIVHTSQGIHTINSLEVSVRPSPSASVSPSSGSEIGSV